MKINIIDFITATKGIRQKDIAKALGVSPAQVSKWRTGEYISTDRVAELNALAGLFGHDHEWALLVGNKGNGQAWINYFFQLYELCEYELCAKLHDESGFLVPEVLKLFSNLGFKFPEQAPSLHYDINSDEELNDFDSIMMEYIDNYNNLMSWFEKFFLGSYISDEIHDITVELECMAIPLALLHINGDSLEVHGISSNKLIGHNEETIRRVTALLHKFCSEMNAKRLPLVTDYFDYVNQHPEILLDKITFRNNQKPILNYLPYSEQNILLGINEIRVVLDYLLKKVARLEDQREKS